MLKWNKNFTDEDYFGQIKVNLNEPKRSIKHGTGVGISAFKLDGKHLITTTLSFSNLEPKQFLFMLSKHFDLFDLKEKGLAVYEGDIK